MHMALINLCMHIECLVSQNYTMGINVKKGLPSCLTQSKE